MNFIDRQFVRAVELIQASESAKSPKDKRRASRTAIRVPVTFKVESDDQARWTGARLHDISARGVQLEIPSALDVGSTFLVRLPTKDGKHDEAPLICRVAHCVPQKHSFLVGAEFTGRLTAPKSPGDDAADLDRIQRSILD